MKPLFWLLIFAVSLAAAEIKTDMQIRILNGNTVSTKVIYNALNTLGQRIIIHRYARDDVADQIEMSLNGRKAFEPKYFNEILRNNGMVITKGTVQNKKWTIEVDASSVLWQIPVISPDEGAQLERSAVPYWFLVNQSTEVAIEAPYGTKWYPDVALLDANMEVLNSFRVFRAQDKLSLKLPEGVMYLKIANTNGMKLLKEGMWVEHAIQEN